jgi:hypothetical protein
MAELTPGERLALAVRAEVARVRADRAKERAASLYREVKPFMDAVDRFQGVHGRSLDVNSGADLAEVVAFAGTDGADVTFATIAAAARASQEAADADAEAAAAMRAVSDAWTGGKDTTVRAWVGADRETFGRAVDAGLAAGA